VGPGVSAEPNYLVCLCKHPRAEHVALLLDPMGDRIVGFGALLLKLPLEPSFRRKPESKRLILDPGFRRGDGTDSWAATTASGDFPAEPKDSDHVHSTWVSRPD
jgi:hypothetical protein